MSVLQLGIPKGSLEAATIELFRRSGSQDQAGEGIGLAHVRSMARNIGGDIVVRSELGTGSIFELTLARDLHKIIGAA